MSVSSNIEPMGERNECWSSLDKGSKRLFRRFASCCDKSIDGMVEIAELFNERPEAAKLRIPTRKSSIYHYPLIAAVLHYGGGDTHPTVAVHLIKTILEQYPEALDQRIPNFYGFDWRPTSGWSLLGISCLKQCHPEVTEFLREELLKRNVSPAQEKDVWTPEALFAAMLIQNVDTVESIIKMNPKCISSTLPITNRESETTSVWRSPQTFAFSSLQQSDFSAKTLELFSQNRGPLCIELSDEG